MRVFSSWNKLVCCLHISMIKTHLILKAYFCLIDCNPNMITNSVVSFHCLNFNIKLCVENQLFHQNALLVFAESKPCVILEYCIKLSLILINKDIMRSPVITTWWSGIQCTSGNFIMFISAKICPQNLTLKNNFTIFIIRL